MVEQPGEAPPHGPGKEEERCQEMLGMVRGKVIPTLQPSLLLGPFKVPLVSRWKTFCRTGRRTYSAARLAMLRKQVSREGEGHRVLLSGAERHLAVLVVYGTSVTAKGLAEASGHTVMNSLACSLCPRKATNLKSHAVWWLQVPPAGISQWIEQNGLEEELSGPVGVLGMVVRTLLVAGSKSFTHTLIILERYSELLHELLSKGGEEAEDRMVAVAAQVSARHSDFVLLNVRVDRGGKGGGILAWQELVALSGCLSPVREAKVS